jgi:pyruvate dehydrogenase E1 component alpha subunit
VHTGACYAVVSRDIAGRAGGFGMAAERVDGADFFAVYEAMGRAVERAKRGEGPSTIEATITRYYGHFEGDPQNYRAKDEVPRLRETMDCLERFRASTGTQLSAADLDAIDSQVLALIEQAVTQAKASPLPAEAELTTDVYISY